MKAGNAVTWIDCQRCGGLVAGTSDDGSLCKAHGLSVRIRLNSCPFHCPTQRIGRAPQIALRFRILRTRKLVAEALGGIRSRSTPDATQPKESQTPEFPRHTRDRRSSGPLWHRTVFLRRISSKHAWAFNPPQQCFYSASTPPQAQTLQTGPIQKPSMPMSVDSRPRFVFVERALGPRIARPQLRAARQSEPSELAQS